MNTGETAVVLTDPRESGAAAWLASFGHQSVRWRPTKSSALAVLVAGVAFFVPASSAWSAVDAGARPAVDASSKGAVQETRASFDCAKASTRIETMICANGEASNLDGQLARAYRLALSSAEAPDALKAEQRAWLTAQRNKCPDVVCLREAYKKRLASFAELATRSPRPLGSPFPPSKPAPPGTAAVRKVRFLGGETTIERIAGIGGDDYERITVRDAEGHVSYSTCNPGDFDSYSALYTRLKEAVVREDRAAVVKLMAYPLRVNDVRGKKSKTFRKQAALLKAYDEVFTPDVLGPIRTLEPADLFCRDGSVTSGSGMLWADYSGGDEPRISLINR